MSYTLFQVLMFFNTEEQRNFSTIKYILAVIDSKGIRTEDKQNLILKALRDASFYDTDYIRSLPQEEKEQIMLEYLRKSEELYKKL